MSRRGLSQLGALLIALGSVGAAAASPTTQKIRWNTIAWQGDHATAEADGGGRAELGLNQEAQEELRYLLGDAKSIAAAGVVVDARSGQVLAAVELGSSDASLLFDPVAPAASVFKLVTTAALYERTNVAPGTRVCTEGGLRHIEREHLVPASGPGAVCSPFGQALGTSRNAAYAQLANTELMRSDLLTVAEALGFNQPLALDAAGSVGSLSLPYNDLEFARAAAGFTGSRLSVFGGAQLALTIASRGVVTPMHFGTEPNRTPAPRVLSQRTTDRLTKAMEVTIHSGTARESFVGPNGRGRLGAIQVAGKTGTLKPHGAGPTSSWFVGFAPSRSPTVVVSILLMNPDRWHQKAHQVARDFFIAYFARRGVRGLNPARPDQARADHAE